MQRSFFMFISQSVFQIFSPSKYSILRVKPDVYLEPTRTSTKEFCENS